MLIFFSGSERVAPPGVKIQLRSLSFPRGGAAGPPPGNPPQKAGIYPRVKSFQPSGIFLFPPPEENKGCRSRFPSPLATANEEARTNEAVLRGRQGCYPPADRRLGPVRAGAAPLALPFPGENQTKQRTLRNVRELRSTFSLKNQRLLFSGAAGDPDLGRHQHYLSRK